MTEKATQIERMAIQHTDAWTAGAPEKIAELFAINGTITVNDGVTHTGHAEIIENAKELLATFPGLVVHCIETRHAGDRAVFIWTLEGRHAETGNSVTLPGWHEWELNDDMKVSRCRGFFDAASFEHQVAGG